MRYRVHIRNAVFALLLCVVLPLSTDGATPNQAACCNVNLPPPSPPGDEQYFSIPGGIPNVMILLDNSGSMSEFPIPIAFPATASNGTCALADMPASPPAAPPLNTYTAKRSNLPYDNGQSSSLVTDAPPWGRYGVAGGCSGDNCLFDPTAYYKSTDTWTTTNANWTSATRYGSGSAAASGSVWPASRDGICRGRTDPAGCQTCLDNSGFYLYYVSGAGGGWRALFKGNFLNGFPPKYVIARKVVKDIAFLDPLNPTPLDQVRLGLTIFTDGDDSGTAKGLRSKDGGVLVVPVGPNCTGSFPYNAVDYGAARQTFVNAVNDITQVHRGMYTPLGETLFNIGQYFTNTGASAAYTTWFPPTPSQTLTWTRTTFDETSVGSINASWAAGSVNRSFCWACEQSSVVIVTDGKPTNDENFPKYQSPAGASHSLFNNDFRGWSNSTLSCPTSATCDTACATGCSGDYLHKVAYFLNQTDLRPDLEGAQKVNTYTISFGLDAIADNDAIAVLKQTAVLGGGDFKNTSSGDELAAALSAAVTDVVSRSTSFSSSSANSLQTAKAAQIGSYLARFRPLQGPAWEGHLFSALIFDEFGMGCDPNKPNSAQTLIPASVGGACAGKNPNFNENTDTSGNANCNDVFLVDNNCDPLIEDAEGAFHKGSFDPVTHQVVSSPDAAALAWDAGKILSSSSATAGYKSAAQNAGNSRKIWTVIDTNGDGKFTSTDGLTEFKPANAAQLAPFMSLDPTWCLSMIQGIGLCGSTPLPACPTVAGWTAANTVTCATQVINFIRGYDVRDLDGDHCAGPGNPSNVTDWGTCTTDSNCRGASEAVPKNSCVSSKCHPLCGSPAAVAAGTDGEERDRPNDARANDPEFWKLGDIFHSAPASVSAPYSHEWCDTGWVQQCLPTLYGTWGDSSPATPLDPGGTVNAYVNYLTTQATRSPLVLAGANDGMLHAFYAGTATSPFTPGEERWAFIPPDLLPRLKLAMFGHQYLVDGNTMVRDIWVDADKDGKKQATEYHTVAVITERSGGHSFTALDITNTDRDYPTFLWTFPQSCTVESRLVGESWSDFPPRPPPIGAVKLKLPYAGSPTDPTSRGWEERWIVMVNGGFDSTLVRGRGVWMLDVYSGQTLWSFTDADLRTGGKNALGYGDKVSLFPVAATIGLVDVGSADKVQGNTDGIFDTATFGDMGGNLWIARFTPAGVIDGTTGRVNNWFVSRTFEEQRRTDNAQTIANRSPFFFMTGNTIDIERGYLRTFAGSGNRQRLLDKEQTCSADNILGCCQAGCTVVGTTATSSAADDYGTCQVAQSFTCAGGVLTSSPAATTGTCTSPIACNQNHVTATLTLDCGSGALPPITANLTCDNAGLCTQISPFGTSPLTIPASGKTLPNPYMYGVWAYGSSGRTFDSLAAAQTFDTHRLTDITYANVCGPATACKLIDTTNASYTSASGVSGLAALPGSLDPGWMYQYGTKCPVQSCSDTPPWADEKTATGAPPWYGCVTFSSTRPTGGTAGTNPCTSSMGSPTAYGYSLDYLTGTPSQACGYFNAGNGYQAYVQNSSAPPQNPMPRLIVSTNGQIKFSTLQITAGSQPTSTTLGYADSVIETLYYLEVPRDLHQCRHVDPRTCE